VAGGKNLVEIELSRGQTHGARYYLQLINWKLRGLDPRKMQKKNQKIK